MAGRTDCPKGFLSCFSPKDKQMIINLKNGHIFLKSRFLKNYWECGLRVFVKLDRDLHLGLMDHSVLCTASPDDVHQHDPPPRQLVSLILLRWHSIVHASREKVAFDDAVWIVYEEWKESLPISKQRAIKYFSKSITAPSTHNFKSRTKKNRLKQTVPRDLVATLRFYSKTSVWPRVEPKPGNEMEESEKDFTETETSSSSEDSDIEVEDPGSSKLNDVANRVPDCSFASNTNIRERKDQIEPSNVPPSQGKDVAVEIQPVMTESITRNRPTEFKKRREPTPKLILKVIALRLNKILQIDPKSGHFYERQKDYNFGRCGRHVFLKIDKDLKLGLMDHSVKCTANCMSKQTMRRQHNHPPPPRPLVNYLLFRWQSILHGQSISTSSKLDITKSIGTVYDNWNEDLPVDKDRAVKSMKSMVTKFQRSLKLHVRHPNLIRWLNWLKIFGTETLEVALAFFAKAEMWPTSEIQPSASGERPITEKSSQKEHNSVNQSPFFLNRRGIPGRQSALIAHLRNIRLFHGKPGKRPGPSELLSVPAQQKVSLVVSQSGNDPVSVPKRLVLIHVLMAGLAQ